ncbi:hypothetical protein MRX96_027417 [Rhipicephalus microplus]
MNADPRVFDGFLPNYLRAGQPALRRGARAACAGADPDGGGADDANSDMGPGSVDLSDLRRRYSRAGYGIRCY